MLPILPFPRTLLLAKSLFPGLNEFLLRKAILELPADLRHTDESVALVGTAVAMAYFTRNRPSVHSWLAGKFPKAGPDVVEDAMQETALALLLKPKVFVRVLREEPEARAVRYLRTVAWRALRHRYRLAFHRRSVFGQDTIIESLVAPARPDEIVEADNLLEYAMVQGAMTHAHGNFPGVYAAVRDTMVLGKTAKKSAEDHNVRREYVSKACAEARRITDAVR